MQCDRSVCRLRADRVGLSRIAVATASPVQSHMCVSGRSCGSTRSESCSSYPKQGPLGSALTRKFFVCRLGQTTISIVEHLAVIPGADGVALHLPRQGQNAAQRATQKTVPTR